MSVSLPLTLTEEKLSVSALAIFAHVKDAGINLEAISGASSPLQKATARTRESLATRSKRF
ncbi:MAG TPA: hypothetical protein EYM95_08105 [Candidatus Obscuribacterales bacterium]|nr:hypothetical protein [Candidatus Obscuribacterales bacterium]